MAANRAAWIREAKALFTVDAAPYVKPDPHQLVIHAKAVAMNPLDWKIQTYAYPSIAVNYPAIFGSDVAGTVVEVGSQVKTIKVGDRVAAGCHGLFTGQSWASAFQDYVVVSQSQTFRLPENVSYAEASVLPLGSATAMTGLYVEKFLGLQLPSSEALPRAGTLLVWGGSSSVGCNAIQLARASGYDVVAVASARNHQLCADLGARLTFDYADPNVVNAIVVELGGQPLVGAYDCIGDHASSVQPCAEILARCAGPRILISVLQPPETGLPAGVTAKRVYVPDMMATSIPTAVNGYLEEALREKRFLPKPDPQVVGHGLERIQDAVTQLKQGVSAAKLVVTL